MFSVIDVFVHNDQIAKDLSLSEDVERLSRSKARSSHCSALCNSLRMEFRSERIIRGFSCRRRFKQSSSVLTRLLVSLTLFTFVSSQSTSLLPSWNSKPQNRTEKLGVNMSLSCRVDNAAGRLLAWTKVWSDGNAAILFVNTSRFQAPSRYLVTTDGDGDLTLVLTYVEKDDDASFKCDVQDSELSAVAQVTVLTNPGIPLISLNSTSDNLVEDLVVQFSCDSSGGNPAPTVKWFRDGVQLPNVTVTPPAVKFGTTSGVVVWQLSRDDFGANFTCTAENKKIPNSLVSNGTLLLVKFAPVISFGRHNPLAVLENSPLGINCTVTAYPEVNSSTIQWFKQGQLIKNGVSFTLSSVSSSDAGIYSCSARNFAIRTANLSLDVQYAPRSPSFQVFKAVEGSPLNLTVAFDANPSVNFSTMKWYNGSTMVDSGRFFTRSVVARTDAGNYTVEATNTLLPSDGEVLPPGVGRASIQLKVSYRPGQAVIGLPPSVIVGQTVEITCTADTLGDPIGDFIWSKDGENGTHPNGKIFRIVAVQLSDIGNYSCSVENEVGRGRQDTEFLDIYEPVQWIQPTLQNKTEMLVNGTMDGILCVARGRPAPIIQWYKDGRPIDPDLFQFVSESRVSEDLRWNTTSALKWEGSARKPLRNSLRPQDAGIYSCRASVSTIEDQIINQTTEIIILYAPLMSTANLQLGSDPGVSAILTCPCMAFPIPSFTWQTGNTTMESGIQFSIDSFRNGSTLTITKMTSQDAGIYSCRATNAIGSSTMTFNLTLNSVPNRPTQLEIVSTTWESVELIWVPGFDGGIPQEFLIDFQAGKAPVESGVSSRFNLTGLYPNTTYIISVYSRNRLGVGSSSINITQTTDVFIVPAPNNVKYRKDLKILSCQLQLTETENFCLQLQVNTTDNLQRNYSKCDLQSDTEVKLDSALSGTEPKSFEVSLCLRRRLDICSVQRSAEFVTFSDLPVRVIVIVCCICGGFIVILLVVICCCCCHFKRKRKSYSDEQRTIDAFESHVTQTEKEEKDLNDVPSFYAEGFDNPAFHQMQQPTILYGKKGPYIDLYPLDRSDSHGSYGSDSGVSVSEVPKTKRIIHEVIV